MTIQIKESQQEPAAQSSANQNTVHAELMAVFDKHPELFGGMRDRINEYLEGFVPGFEQLQWALVLLEVKRDPETGQPITTPDGKFQYPLMDKNGFLLFERFLKWQRCWYLWPQLEQDIKNNPGLSEDAKKSTLKNIECIKILLNEGTPSTSGVC